VEVDEGLERRAFVDGVEHQAEAELGGEVEWTCFGKVESSLL
jgi:hypothetical protein